MLGKRSWPATSGIPKTSYDYGGVGLGIVAALEKSDPIPVIISKGFVQLRGYSRRHEEIESSENYTYVTCRGPDRKSVTRVYYDGGVSYGKSAGFHGAFRGFDLSPQTKPLGAIIAAEDCDEFCVSGFLSSCHLCRKALQGKDIFMYRGEKAFCSAECRQRQIAMDEGKEQCRSLAARALDVSSTSSSTSSGTPYASRGQNFSAGIFAV